VDWVKLSAIRYPMQVPVRTLIVLFPSGCLSKFKTIVKLMCAKAVFLDKDGTLIEDVPYNVDPERIQLTHGF